MVCRISQLDRKNRIVSLSAIKQTLSVATEKSSEHLRAVTCKKGVHTVPTKVFHVG